MVDLFIKPRWDELRAKQPCILDIAPTEYSGQFLRKTFAARQVYGFDLANRWAGVRGDLQTIGIKSDSFDFFLCSEVLDYVRDDAAALAELWRVLKPGAYGLIVVRCDESTSLTVEFPEPDPFDSYHIRRYGQDLFSRIKSAKFTYEVLESTGLEAKHSLRTRISPLILVQRPLK